MLFEDKARKFFDLYVKPGFLEWEGETSNIRFAANLSNSLNNLVEYYWQTYYLVDSGKVFHKASLKDFRNELAKININISLIRDIADSHKHLILSRPNKTITNADQVKTKMVGFGEAYGLCYGGGELVVVVSDSGDETYFSFIAESAYKYWFDIFQ